jgi:hypothetical protein
VAAALVRPLELSVVRLEALEEISLLRALVAVVPDEIRERLELELRGRVGEREMET